jgi:predicted esterase
VAAAGAPLNAHTKAVVIMVHGRGAAPEKILDLAPRLDRDGISYLAPAAAGRTWYPYSFMADSRKNEPALSSALHVLGRLVSRVMAAGITRERILLLGFSQGACLASEFAIRNAARYGGVVAFSGGLIGAPGTTWNYGGSFGGTPVFLGCGDPDSHVPRARVDESADAFRRMGADVTERIYPGMGHLVSDEEIAFAQGILDRAAGSAAPGSPA